MHPLPSITRCLWSTLTLLCLSADSYANTSATKPNIVLIFVDDMGYGDPGCYGGSLVPTPKIDSLTEPGIRFTQGYSISPVCGPSRVGLLSGMQPSRIGVYWNPDMGAVKMPKGHQVLPQALKTAGYSTGLVGKWNLNNPGWDPMPAGDYFDQTYDVMVWEGDYWPNENGAYKGRR
jgi:arylsulfatase A-like enzyme